MKTAILFAVFNAFVFGADSNWPQFRGPDAAGVASGSPPV